MHQDLLHRQKSKSYIPCQSNFHSFIESQTSGTFSATCIALSIFYTTLGLTPPLHTCSRNFQSFCINQASSLVVNIPTQGSPAGLGLCRVIQQSFMHTTLFPRLQYITLNWTRELSHYCLFLCLILREDLYCPCITDGVC